MIKAKINDDVLKIISQMFPESGYEMKYLHTVDLIDDLMLDSITFVSLIMELEDYFKIIIDDDSLQMNQFRTIDNIVNIVYAHLLKQKSC